MISIGADVFDLEVYKVAKQEGYTPFDALSLAVLAGELKALGADIPFTTESFQRLLDMIKADKVP